ncbi:hypothetical protein V8E54_007159 [Elaphomyces granulatus]
MTAAERQLTEKELLEKGFYRRFYDISYVLSTYHTLFADRRINNDGTERMRVALVMRNQVFSVWSTFTRGLERIWFPVSVTSQQRRSNAGLSVYITVRSYTVRRETLAGELDKKHDVYELVKLTKVTKRMSQETRRSHGTHEFRLLVRLYNLAVYVLLSPGIGSADDCLGDHEFKSLSLARLTCKIGLGYFWTWSSTPRVHGNNSDSLPIQQ